ncbi:MAG: hypothetical protein H6702_10275 [Myxococcales bacterium]|nr:hypothetical protein [Myxococcales bacterium]
MEQCRAFCGFAQGCLAEHCPTNLEINLNDCVSLCLEANVGDVACSLRPACEELPGLLATVDEALAAECFEGGAGGAGGGGVPDVAPGCDLEGIEQCAVQCEWAQACVEQECYRGAGADLDAAMGGCIESCNPNLGLVLCQIAPTCQALPGLLGGLLAGFECTP